MLPFMEQKNTDLFLYDYKSFSFPAHFHSGLEIIFALKEPITLTVNGSDHLVKEGSVGVVLPEEVHSYHTPEGIDNEGKVILLGQRLLGEYAKKLSGKRLTEPVIPLSALHPDCETAVSTLISAANEDVLLQKTYAALFLCRFIQAADFDSADSPSDTLLLPLVRYMGDHYRESIGLGDAAEALYVSKYHLSRIFSRVMKMNFNDYLNSLRVNAAIGLLDSTDLPVTKIAYEVGFGNVRTFNHAFLKHTGSTPAAFRRGKRGTGTAE